MKTTKAILVGFSLCLFFFITSLSFAQCGKHNKNSQSKNVQKSNQDKNTKLNPGEYQASFKVFGNCGGGCKNRIEKAAKATSGVKSADWDVETKILTISYDADKTKLEDVHKNIAKAGHDTEKAKADDDIYGALPGCCQYERAEKTKLNQSKNETSFKVLGNCGMCKSRIEKAAKTIDWVKSADWDDKTKMLTISYDSKKANLKDVHKNIAKAGHDTEKARAEDDIYGALPGCCQYERLKK